MEGMIETYATRVAALCAAVLAGAALLTGFPWLAGVAALVAVAGALWPAGSPVASPPRVRAGAPLREETSDSAAPQTAVIIATDPRTALAHMLGATARSCGASCAHLWLLDPPTASLRLVSSVGDMCPSGNPVSCEEPWAAPPVTRGDSALEPVLHLRDQAVSTTLWRFAFPVMTGAASGVACLDIRSDVMPDRSRLESVGVSYQPAFAAVLAVHVAHTESEQAGNLLEAARELGRRLSADDVIACTLDRALALSAAATGSIMLPDAETGLLRIVAAQGLPADVVDRTVVSPGEGIAGWVYQTGKPLLVEDMQTPDGTMSRRREVRSAVCVPIGDEDGVIGVLSVGSREYPARFTDVHLGALATLARVAAMALRNARALASTQDLYFATLTALAVALETKDPYSRGGAGRVVNLVVALGEAIGLDERQRRSLRVAALLHDIGMGIAGGSVSTGTRPLSTAEQGMLKAHPVVAAQVLQDIPALEDVVPIVYHHHEWFDGHGYVGGLEGEDIPLGSRILAVADAFVAMTSDRPYRRAMSADAALAEMGDKSGAQFDPDCVQALVDVLRYRPDLAVTEALG
jgi:HD-GYP domain-containing protein (c-di-GMP phosphodiesterase class II)